MENLMGLFMGIISIAAIALVVAKRTTLTHHANEVTVEKEQSVAKSELVIEDVPNIVSIVGNLVADPVLRTVNTKNGETSVISGHRMCVAVSNVVTGMAEFYNYVIWGKEAEAFARHAKKGMRVILSGRCVEEAYLTKDGRESINKTLTVSYFRLNR